MITSQWSFGQIDYDDDEYDDKTDDNNDDKYEDSNHDDDDDDHLDQMINSEGAGKGVKLWGDVLAESVVHVKPDYSCHHDKIGEDSIAGSCTRSECNPCQT